MEHVANNDVSKITPELYFLIAKFLSSGPLRETSEVLRRELEKCKILPKRLDWEGNSREQSFEDLERQFPSIDPQHLLRACASLVRPSKPHDPRRSLLASNVVDKEHLVAVKPCPKNIACRLRERELLGNCQSGGAINHTPLPPSIFSGLKLQRRTLGHLSAVYCVLYDCTGKYIMTGADDLLVKVWSAIDGRLLGTFRGASAEITDMAVDMDNTMLAAGSLDRLIRVWDLQTQAPVAVLQGHSGMITSVHFCPAKTIGDLRYLASTSTDGSVAFWTYSQTDEGKASFISKPTQYVERLRPGACQMICGAWSPGGKFFASGSADHNVRIYMMAEQGPKRIVETAAHGDAVDSLQWAHSGLRFVSGSKDGTAILWQLHATQWRHTRLDMCDTLPGLPDPNLEGKKLKVTMVVWDCTDEFIITAVNDHTLKVWWSRNGQLLRILSGHKDEIYVLESHPSLSQVLLSAGHDGQMFVWDTQEGLQLASFLNDIEGQGHGAVFDAKWAPDGAAIAATDSHGHILMLGLGQGHPRLQKLPFELFFHTDYRPLVRDSQGGVCDEQTGTPPHLMPPPFLVDVEGAPHPPSMQRLVPGREHAALDQLVPDTGDAFSGDDPPSRIDMMIEALALQQALQDVLPAGAADRAVAFVHGTFAGRPGRDGVRRAPGGEWQRGAPLSVCRRPLIVPLPQAQIASMRTYISQMTQMESNWYSHEMRRRPLMISTGGASVIGGGANAGNGPGRRNAGRTKKAGAATRRPPRPKPRPPISRVVSVNNIQSPLEDDGEAAEDDASTQKSVDSSDTSVELSANDYSTSSCSSSEQSEDGSSSTSSSDYSDWVASQPGRDLAPPKRSKRRPVARKRYSPQQTSAKKGPSVHVTNGNEISQNAAIAGPSSSSPTLAASHSPPKDIPEAYRLSEWLCAVVPRKTPYHPQMGDECIYFKQGHMRYLEAVSEKDEYKVSSKDKPWERCNIKECEVVKVVGIKYLIRPPRLVCLKLAILDPTLSIPMTGRSFTVKYHDMADVLDFLVLRQSYETAIERQWAVDDRFRCMIDDCWWMGCVMAVEQPPCLASRPARKGVILPQAHHFLSLRVRWDNGEHERMSPWDLEPIDDNRLPAEVGGSVSVLPEELERTLYVPRPEEWGSQPEYAVVSPSGSPAGIIARARRCDAIVRALDDVMALAIAEPFVAPVDLGTYPTYAYIVEYPIDLSTIKARFQNRFYRRLASAQFDVRYLATNAEKFNMHQHTHIIKQARIITDLCLQVISDPGSCLDVGAAYRRLVDSYHSSDSDAPIVKPSGSGSGPSWRAACKNVLEELWSSKDSHPFRDPVGPDTAPDYLQIVDTPMDLGTIRNRLFSSGYKSPEQFAADVRLIFENSKQYNTNKRSRIYSMTIRLSTLFDALIRPIMYNWKAARRRSSGSGRGWSRQARKKRMKNGFTSVASDDEVLSQIKLNGNKHDTSDSDAPLRVVNGKGKGKGKRTRRSSSPMVRLSMQAPHPPAPSTRASVRSKATTSRVSQEDDSTIEYEDIQVLDEEMLNFEALYDSLDDRPLRQNGTKDSAYEDEDEQDPVGEIDCTSDELYTPGRRNIGDPDFRRRKRKRKGRRKRGSGGSTAKNAGLRRTVPKLMRLANDEDEDFTLSRRRRPTNSHNAHKGSTRKRRKLTHRSRHASVDSTSPTESSETELPRSRRYESDHSYKGKSDSDDEEDDDRPLGIMQRISRTTAKANISMQTNGANRGRRSGGTRPQYNEDSEEDSIAAISKRLRAAYQATSAIPTPNNGTRGRMQVGGVRDGPGVASSSSSTMRAQSSSHGNARPGPSTSSQHTDHSYYNGNADATEPEDNEPLLISSRGRIRKLTAKARNLLRE